MTAKEAIDVLFNEWKCIDRNDGIHCDRKCETCDLVMDVGIIREAFNMAISALQAQDSPKPTAESVQNVKDDDLVSRKVAIDTEGLEEEIRCEMCKNPMHTDKGCDGNCKYDQKLYEKITQILDKRIMPLPSAQPELQWTQVGEKLPRINQRVLLASSGGTVFIGNRCKPELIWQVTEEDGRKHWVYDPEDYTDDIDSLPKSEDCAFEQDSRYEDAMLSVSSKNYDPRFEGVIAWMPLPEPYRAERRTDD